MVEEIQTEVDRLNLVLKWKKDRFWKNIFFAIFPILKRKFCVFCTQTCRRWTKLFTWTCHFPQESHALKEGDESLFCRKFQTSKCLREHKILSNRNFFLPYLTGAKWHLLSFWLHRYNFCIFRSTVTNMRKNTPPPLPFYEKILHLPKYISTHSIRIKTGSSQIGLNIFKMIFNWS